MKFQSMVAIAALSAGVLLSSCCCVDKKCCTENSCEQDTKAPYQKKYTNKDFYDKNGKFLGDVALKAYLDMFEYYNIPYNEFLKENMWISDFNLGDFENVGMAGVFWVNNPIGGYVGHNIYLLPGQCIVEHKHMKTKFPAKIESWYVEHGSVYNWGIGDTTPNPPAIPETQKKAMTISHFTYLQEGDTATLAAPESAHFLQAGDNGAIVLESGNYHDGSGLNFTNKEVQFIDILAEMKENAIDLQK